MSVEYSWIERLDNWKRCGSYTHSASVSRKSEGAMLTARGGAKWVIHSSDMAIIAAGSLLVKWVNANCGSLFLVKRFFSDVCSHSPSF